MATPIGPFPANFENDVAALMPDLMWDDIYGPIGGDKLLEKTPFSYQDANVIRWDQWTNPYGLAPLRGLDDAPQLVAMPGYKVSEATPGYYGMGTKLLESTITAARQPGTLADPIEVGDLLSVYTQVMATMNVSRFRKTVAELYLDGKFVAKNASGELVNSYQIDNYQTFAPANDGNTGPGWAADPANATPLTDLLYWQQRLNRGTSADFGPDSELIMNPVTLNIFWNTRQVQSAFKSQYGASFLRGNIGDQKSDVPVDGKNSVNELLVGMGLPKIVVYKRGYYETLTGAISEDPDEFTYAIADEGIIWFGKRPGNQQIGAFALTRFAGKVAESDMKAYPSTKISNEQVAALGEGLYFRAKFHDTMPHHYYLESGFNGGPISYYRRGSAGIQTG